MTIHTSKGILNDFLKDVKEDNSHKEQLEKFTDLNGSFKFTEKTKLEPVAPEVEEQIRDAFVSTKYGATIQKTGWHVPEWNNTFFQVLDAARRVGSGVGSYGVDRFYVLLNGKDNRNIILDVKYEPVPAFWNVLSDDDKAWYGVLFQNDAARVVEAQRRLTSFVDPFTGWILIDGRPFSVRERSPWKDDLDLDDVTKFDDFKGLMEMVAIATATSHTRGTQAKAPGEFKQVIDQIFVYKSQKKRWGEHVASAAQLYHQQVKLDYNCFKEYVDTNYPL